jgi:hypothetical protein
MFDSIFPPLNPVAHRAEGVATRFCAPLNFNQIFVCLAHKNIISVYINGLVFVMKSLFSVP